MMLDQNRWTGDRIADTLLKNISSTRRCVRRISPTCAPARRLNFGLMDIALNRRTGYSDETVFFGFAAAGRQYVACAQQAMPR